MAMNYSVRCQWVSCGEPEEEVRTIEKRAGARAEKTREAPNTGVLFPDQIREITFTGTRAKTISVFENLSGWNKIHNLRLVRIADHDGNTDVRLKAD